ncbi:MAG: alanine racemase [Myxococcales bacterium]|nr:alanine racemase [Myxococcales bacterium]
MPVLSLDDVKTPALLLDIDVLRENLLRMAARARGAGIRLRPHIKTHACLRIGRMQQELGAQGLTVSTLREAELFADAGFDDLIWAFPFTRADGARVEALGSRISLGVLVDSLEAIEWLAALSSTLSIWIELDCGHHRSGLDPKAEALIPLARAIVASPRLRFAGLLTHPGQAYAARGSEEVRAVARAETAALERAKRRLQGAGLEVPALSGGSTPTAWLGELPGSLDELRPGNYCFHDRTQLAIGACSLEDCALTVLSTVISSQGDPPRSVLDAGALALSMDPGPPELSPAMGWLLEEGPDGPRLGPPLRWLSQEHGVLDQRLPLGQRVRILPNHACYVTSCFEHYVLVSEARVVGRLPIAREPH